VSDTKQAKRYLVSGMVQGVGFRAVLERGPRFSSVTEVLEEPAVPDRQYEGDFFINPSD
jgi:hypothetical protein